MKKLFSLLLVLALVLSAAAMAECKIAINLKTLSSEYWQTVKSGCDQYAEENPDVVIDVQDPSVESAIQEQVDQIETMLSGNPDAIIIDPDDGDAVIGALNACQAAGIDGVTIIGFDGNTSAVELITAGSLKATIAQQPKLRGYLSVEAAVKVLGGETVEPNIVVDTVIIDGDNCADYLQ